MRRAGKHQEVLQHRQLLIPRGIEERKNTVCMWLSAAGMEADQQRHHGNQLPGTCDWLSKISLFRDWFDTESSGCLCVLGISGCGKSVLSSSVIDKLKSSGQPVLYFFCKDGDENRNNPSAILRTLIFQLVKYEVSIDIVHAAASDGIPVRDYSLLDLWNIMRKLLDIIDVVYLVIDGLDECNNIDGMLVDLLKRLATLPTSKPKGVKVFATCRPNRFDISWPTISIAESDLTLDLEIYIADRVNKSQTLQLDELKDEVHLAIQQGAGGTFL